MKLGELFVDLGVNSGGAFNALSSFAFKFENLANLGGRVAKIIDDVVGEAPKWASSIKYLSESVDLSQRQIQNLEASSAVYSQDVKSAIGLYKSLWSEYYNWWRTGDQGFLEKWGIFGPDVINKLTTEVNKPIDLINLLLDSMEQVGDKSDLMYLRDVFGMTPELQKVFELYSRGGPDVTTLTNEAIDSLSKFREERQLLELQGERDYAQWTSQLAPMFTDWIKKINDLKRGYYEATSESAGFWDFIGRSASYIFGELPDRMIEKFTGNEKERSAEYKRNRNKYWKERYGHAYDDFSDTTPVAPISEPVTYEEPEDDDEILNLGDVYDNSPSEQIHSSIDFEKALAGAIASNGVYSPTFNTTVNTDVGNVGNVIRQANNASIEGARNGRIALMLGRGMVG